MGTLGPVTALSARYDIEGVHDIDVYERHGGYDNARAALDKTPDEMIQMIKDSGLRGRGGAGFPTGLKWSFIAQDTGKPVYLVVNADESEPGTFKDRLLMERDPHSLVDGIIASCLAIQSEMAYVYARGEFGWVSRRLRKAIEQAYERGYLGSDIFGSGKRVDITLHRGAAAYIVGEETALLESLEGRRGAPRLRPPFPAAHGVYGCPSTVNNVETVTAAGYVIGNGPEWFNQYGTEKSPGPKLMCISGEVKRPGNYEFALGTPINEMIAAAGGMLDDRELKFFFPGGSSTPILTAEHAELAYTFEAMAEAGSLLGTGALMVHSDKTSVVEVVSRYVKFYEHESCGKCTPCREGSYWLSQVYDRILGGRASDADIEMLPDVSENIFGRAFCALGDALVTPVTSSLKYFRDEYEQLLRSGGQLPDHMTSIRTATASDYLDRNDLATAGV